MSSNPFSRANYLSQSSKQLPLQPLNENQQDHSLTSRYLKDKPYLKSNKQIEQQQMPIKSKAARQQKLKENIQESKTTSISIICKIPDEKEEALTVPSQDFKSKKREKTAKNFQDLNKSLANLALRRCVGRSSSDNEGIGQLNYTDTDLYHQSYGPSCQYIETQPADSSTSQTPFGSKRPTRGIQTSVYNTHDVSPFGFLNEETRENGKLPSFQNRRDTYSNNLDLNYWKTQGVSQGKTARNTQNTHLIPTETRSRTQRRNLATEGSCGMEISHFENYENIETQMYSQFFSNDVQLSYLGADYYAELESEYMKDNGFETPLDSLRQVSSRQGPELKTRAFEKNSADFVSFASQQQNFRFTPSFQEFMKGKNNNGNLANHGNNSNLRRYSDLASTSKINTKKSANKYEKKNKEKLELNSISDGVKYTRGGVGMNSQLRKNQKYNVRNKSNLTVPESNERSLKFEEFNSVKKETIESWKQDIMKIKQDMETRKKSYAELNKFVEMYEESNNTLAKESEGTSLENSMARKNSLISLSNLSKLEKVESAKHYSNSLRLKTNGVESGYMKIPQRNNKASFDMKTSTDYDDQKSSITPLEELASATSRFRVKTSPYDFTDNNTCEFNNSFVYEENMMLERTQKVPCCGSGKICNIF